MDLIAYLLNSVIESTTPPGETAADAYSRGAAIAAMLRAYDPSDGMEAMMACQCVMMQFLLNAAVRDANNPQLTPVLQAKARAGAISASRTLHQWVTKFENSRKRNEMRAAEAAKAQAAALPAVALSSARKSPEAPLAPPVSPSEDRPTAPTPVPNGQAAAGTPPNPMLATDLIAMPPAVMGQSVPAVRHPAPPVAPVTEAAAA